MKRDTKGRFTKKCEEGVKIILGIPSIKKIVIWILLIAILMRWISIIAKYNIFKKILNLFDKLIRTINEDAASPKKNGLFS